MVILHVVVIAIEIVQRRVVEILRVIREPSAPAFCLAVLSLDDLLGVIPPLLGRLRAHDLTGGLAGNSVLPGGLATLSTRRRGPRAGGPRTRGRRRRLDGEFRAGGEEVHEAPHLLRGARNPGGQRDL